MIENNSSLAMFFGTTAAIGGVLFVIRLILFLVGAGDQELGGGDGNLEGGSDSSFQFISLQGVAGFFTMFGLVGLAMHSGGQGTWISVAGAVVSGLITLWLVSMIFQSMRRMQSDGTLRISNAIGEEGTVYLTIPDNGTGQVQVAVQGGLKIFNAVSADHQRIPTGASIRVVKIVSGNMLMVEQVNNP
jgi:membrane protein implicated in regulation of membrane protease activity